MVLLEAVTVSNARGCVNALMHACGMSVLASGVRDQ